jgi:hypothetical protein
MSKPIKEQWMVARRSTDACLSSYKIVKLSTVWDFVWVQKRSDHVPMFLVITLWWTCFLPSFGRNCLCVQSTVTKWQPCGDGRISMWWDSAEFYSLVDVGQNTRFVATCTSLSVWHSDNRENWSCKWTYVAVFIPIGNTSSSQNMESPTTLYL